VGVRIGKRDGQMAMKEHGLRRMSVRSGGCSRDGPIEVLGDDGDLLSVE